MHRAFPWGVPYCEKEAVEKERELTCGLFVTGMMWDVV